jgi:hypothetical protein
MNENEHQELLTHWWPSIEFELENENRRTPWRGKPL